MPSSSSFTLFHHLLQRFLQSSSMAPKRRRKAGLTRMDAALDQMSSFGFSRQLVRKTVRNLLKVYGGDDGWIFIEEGGYKVLLGVLLDEQETTEQTQSLLPDASSSKIGSSGTELVTAESYEVAAEGTSSPGNNNASSANYTGSENKERWKDIGLDETTEKSPFDSGDNDSANGVNPQCSEDPPVLESALVPADSDTPVNVPIRRHKPCYGWISDDDDSDGEPKFIALTPAN
ncbi:hypothetical protein OSB04_018074 [Centaurea solstitialis]|uniref:WIYLD domain-containing protein n=1 Tax=Centaurea solstitialis TaxID=347529 RepID=A0AA38WLC3_9ASTR|nr:hypothetical protein OSB04_018074 [Centaurea solstitialis]